MKKNKIDFMILILLLFFSGTTLLAQEESDNGNKRVVIVTKTIDENGNETTERIIKEDLDGTDVFIVHDVKGPDQYQDVEVVVNGENKEKKVKFRVKKNGEEEVEIIEWDGESEVPEHLFQILEGRGIDMEINDDLNVFRVKRGDAPNRACLGVMIGLKEHVEIINGEERTITKWDSEGGVSILNVIEDSGAADAGLQEEDVITKINGTEVANVQDVLDVLSPFDNGETIAIDYLRAGQAVQVKATLKACANPVVEGSKWDEENGKDLIIIKNGVKAVEDQSRVIIRNNKRIEEEAVVEEVVEEAIEETPVVPGLFVRPPSTLELTALDIFPNPTDSKLTLDFSAPDVSTMIKIVDISGRVVYKEALNNFDGKYNKVIDLSHVAKGTLVLTIEQNGNVFSEKIILQ